MYTGFWTVWCPPKRKKIFRFDKSSSILFQDFGLVQLSTTEKIQPHIQSTPVLTRLSRQPTQDITSRVVSLKLKKSYDSIILVVCCGFCPTLRIFHSYGDVTITGEGLQILSCTRHSWPWSSEDSLACHTYCDFGHLSIMVISEDLWLGFEHPTLRTTGECSNWLRHSCGFHHSDNFFGFYVF